MLEVLFFISGFVAKAVMGYAIGKIVASLLNNLQDLPTVTHYLQRHQGKSYNCEICKNGDIKPVDTIH